MGAAAAVGGGIAVAGLAGSALSASAAESGAKTAANAQMSAAQLQESQYQNNIANLQPYNTAGQANLPALQAQAGISNNALTGAYNAAQAQLPQQMSQAQLVSTPGYLFNLSQGEKQISNSQSAMGLSNSGATTKAALAYNTGLSNSTYSQQLANQATVYNGYNQQFNNMYNQQGLVYNQLAGPAQLGEAAAAQAGVTGQLGAAAAGSNIAGAGATLAAGSVNAANAIGSGLNSVANGGLTYLGLSNALSSGNGLASGAGLNALSTQAAVNSANGGPY